MHGLLRIVIALSAALATGLTVAITLALIDIYLAGHDRPSFVHAPATGLAPGTTWGDVIFLGSALLAALAAWIVNRRRV